MKLPTPASLALSAVLILGGCAAVQIGHDFDSTAFATIVQRGVTTQAEVHARLGAPTSTGVVVDTSGARYTRWVYYYGRATPPRMDDMKFKSLEVQFDENNKVKSYNWSASE